MHKLLGLLVLASLCLLGQISAQDAQGRCPYCVGRTCGPNGLGGTCGNCTVGQKCVRGVCICDRGCDGKECGADNCGTLCGTCLTGQTCNNGICSGSCTPQCTRPDGTLRTCGWDRCAREGRCGTCPNSETCNFRCRDGTCECVPNCDNKHCGDDGCGGSCGTCADGGICQGASDPFPGQCYFNCYIEMRVEVRENRTRNLVGSTCSVVITGPNAFSAPNNTYPGPNPGFFAVDISKGKYGTYSFTTNCPGYQLDFESHAVNVSGQLVTILVEWNTIQIEVRDEETKALLPSASILITSGSYSLTVAWVSPIYTWSHNGFLTYSFTTSSAGYATRTETRTVTASTTLITLFLSKGAITIRVVECPTQVAVSTATITTGSTTINYNNGASFVPNNGFTTYTFTTASPNYVSNTESVAVTTSTTSITLCVNLRPIAFNVISCASQNPINGASVAASSSSFASYSFSFTYSSAGTTWTPVGYGSYSFSVSASGYTTNTSVQAVSISTSSITVCLPETPFCGDGVCAGSETALPTSASRCFDCGRLRGVISLAVGQKDQLVNITVSVWADPVNPALFLRNGTAVPTPHFTTLSDSKGFFSINTLSFDAGVNNRAQGQAKRRFYFSLSGQYVDRTSGVDVTTTLLTLWWNYELTNTQWSGTGNLTNTNNSPSFYFYMTPPFTTADALIRVILSWGTLISNPANSLPDLDLVVAGPVDAQSIQLYGNGVVNFQNKDLHSSTKELPYAKLVTDSAQGYGPEVMDFYGVPGELNLGFSSSYAAGAAANAYEIWVDRPNSSPNQDSAFTFIYDTNAFIIVYQNDGTQGGNKQVLFDTRTKVPYAYGFYNTDIWNKVPSTATLWHIIDLSQSAGGVVYNGFPGENNTADTSGTAGAKYGYDGQFFEKTKSLPCGHVAGRGASPAYCPATLTYPQTKK